MRKTLIMTVALLVGCSSSSTNVQTIAAKSPYAASYALRGGEQLTIVATSATGSQLGTLTMTPVHEELDLDNGETMHVTAKVEFRDATGKADKTVVRLDTISRQASVDIDPKGPAWFAMLVDPALTTTFAERGVSFVPIATERTYDCDNDWFPASGMPCYGGSEFYCEVNYSDGIHLENQYHYISCPYCWDNSGSYVLRVSRNCDKWCHCNDANHPSGCADCPTGGCCQDDGPLGCAIVGYYSYNFSQCPCDPSIDCDPNNGCYQCG